MRVRAIYWCLGVSFCLFAIPAAAAPAMFRGFLEGTSSYAPFCMPGYRYLGGGPNFSCKQSASETVSVMQGSGGFTVPQGVFTLASSYTAVFPGYPFFTFEMEFSQTGKGSFRTGYFPKSFMTTLAVDTAGFPKLSGTTRSATIMVTVGSRGFGGNMNLSLYRDYYWTTAGQLGLYDVTLTFRQLRGRGAPWNSRAGRGRFVNQTLETTGTAMNPLQVAHVWGSSRFPFFTGTIRVYQPQGFQATTWTATGSDTRTTPLSGMVSLVSPSLLYGYRAFPDEFGAVVGLTGAFGAVDKLNVSFLPESSRLGLLVGGLLGLLGLSRRRGATDGR